MPTIRVQCVFAQGRHRARSVRRTAAEAHARREPAPRPRPGSPVCTYVGPHASMTTSVAKGLDRTWKGPGLAPGARVRTRGGGGRCAMNSSGPDGVGIGGDEFQPSPLSIVTSDDHLHGRAQHRCHDVLGPSCAANAEQAVWHDDARSLVVNLDNRSRHASADRWQADSVEPRMGLPHRQRDAALLEIDCEHPDQD